MPRRRALPLLLLPALMLTACGGPAKTGSAHETHRGLPPLLARAPKPKAMLRPVATETSLGRQGGASLQAPLTGTGQDTITLQLTPDGDGQVNITQGAATIFQKQHVSGASVLAFGRRHLPVLLLQDSFNLCGSGGCQTSAYTWSPSRQAMLPVPAPGIPAYRWSPGRRQFLLSSAPLIGGLFGFVTPGRDGIVLQARTYDVWQHSLAQSYAYAPGLSATGGWVAVGAPRYTPSGRESGVAFADPGQALLALLTARSMGFQAQVAQVSASPADEAAVWRNLRAIGAWQGTLYAILPAPQVQVTGATATASDRITGLVGQGPQAKLEAYEVTAVVAKIGAAYLVQDAHLAPLAVRVRSAASVLAAIRRTRLLLRDLARDGNPPLVVQAVGQQWQVSLAGRGSMQDQPWIEIDALTGKVGSMH